MSFTYINPHSGQESQPYERGMSMELIAPKSLYVESLSTAVILHDFSIRIAPGGVVFICRFEGIFVDRGLMVDCGYITEGPVRTELFNYSSDRVRIGKGECISKLIAL